jgi:threonine aldolase
LLGIQFDTLFTNGLYMEISAHAIRMAMKLKTIFAEKGIPFYIDSPTNQQFPILTSSQMAELEGKIAFEIWEILPDGRAVTRFATSWATKEESIKTLQQLIG